jgi:hypothetical protein
LSVAGNKLSIAIPEGWLSEAKYPVVVDPTFGMETVGSQTHWENFFTGAYEKLVFESSVGLNRHSIFEPLSGIITAYVYVYVYVYVYDSEGVGRCKPVLYSNDLSTFMTRLSKSEGSFDIAVNSDKPAGWRSATFQTKDTIEKYNWLWFGVFCDRFSPRFDYSTMCIFEQVGNDLPETLTPILYPYNFEISMYFAYALEGFHTRVITQWAMPSETRKLTGEYQRSATQIAQGKAVANRAGSFCRSIVQTVKSAMSMKRRLALLRKSTQQAGVSDKGQRFLSMLRKPAQTAGVASGTMRNAAYVKRFQEKAGSMTSMGIVRDVAVRLIGAVAALYGMKAGAGFNRRIRDASDIGSMMGGAVLFFRALFGMVGGRDGAGSFMTCMRLVQDTATMGDKTGHTADYLRGLFVEAGNMAKATRRGTYCRTQQDMAGSKGVALWHLFVFLRLLTGAYIRDYSIGRFLKSKEELIIKSPVCREIVIDSKLH